MGYRTGGVITVWPRFTLTSQIELLIPMLLSVAAGHNIQGITVLRAAKYETPINSLTLTRGIAGAFQGLLGAPSACITGPTNSHQRPTLPRAP